MAGDQTATDGLQESAATVHRIEFDVEWPPGHVAAYLIEDDEPILVDAGMPGEDNEAALHAGLADAGHDLADVEHVVCTHPHVDHIGLVPELRAAGDPTVYAPASYREALDRPVEAVEERVRETVRRAGVPGEYLDPAVERAVERHRTIRGLLPAEAVDVWMADGDPVTVGDRTFEAVHAAGHQRDHLCLETDLDGERAMLSGDMVIEPFRAAAVHANFDAEQTEAVTAYYRGLDRLEGRDVDRVYPGHGPVHASFDAAVEGARESLDSLLDRTEGAVRPSGTHAVHAAATRVDDVTDGPYIPEAIGALAHLEREGRVESYLKDDTRYYVPA